MKVLITTVSSNINEVIRAILNFFIQKFHNHKKAQNAYKRTKIKNAPKNHIRKKRHLFAYLWFCAFAEASLWLLVLLVLLVLLGAFSAFWCFLVLFVRVKSFHKKNKKFKIPLIA